MAEIESTPSCCSKFEGMISRCCSHNRIFSCNLIFLILHGRHFVALKVFVSNLKKSGIFLQKHAKINKRLHFLQHLTPFQFISPTEQICFKSYLENFPKGIVTGIRKNCTLFFDHFHWNCHQLGSSSSTCKLNSNILNYSSFHLNGHKTFSLQKEILLEEEKPLKFIDQKMFLQELHDGKAFCFSKLYSKYV